ncbi:gamma-aminobutyrate transporter [Escherichia coli]|uniref:Gamma-aminobutyrate transporter n=1 Tax=Escherichia coli TaxID=562 RepID=A0A377AHR9_ECOLX|nr:gamma-aminobutyrate transporter [Escherichia coli]
MGQSSQPHELGGGLKSRHVTMLSIAGVIGASLFVGSQPSPSPKRARRYYWPICSPDYWWL